VVAHLGGGTSVGLHVGGRVVDVNNALDGEGPLSIERAGTVPAGDWMRFVLAHRDHSSDLQARLTGRGGLVAWLGTNDFTAIERAAVCRGAGPSDKGPPAGSPIVQAREGTAAPGGLPDGALCDELISTMCYQVAKAVCGLAAFTAGHLDATAVTGGLAQSARVVREITDRVSFLAPVLVYPGENELEALALGMLEALSGTVAVRVYGD
jgi:butyrate kinase